MDSTVKNRLIKLFKNFYFGLAAIVGFILILGLLFLLFALIQSVQYLIPILILVSVMLVPSVYRFIKGTRIAADMGADDDSHPTHISSFRWSRVFSFSGIWLHNLLMLSLSLFLCLWGAPILSEQIFLSLPRQWVLPNTEIALLYSLEITALILGVSFALISYSLIKSTVIFHRKKAGKTVDTDSSSESRLGCARYIAIAFLVIIIISISLFPIFSSASLRIPTLVNFVDNWLIVQNLPQDQQVTLATVIALFIIFAYIVSMFTSIFHSLQLLIFDHYVRTPSDGNENTENKPSNVDDKDDEDNKGDKKGSAPSDSEQAKVQNAEVSSSNAQSERKDDTTGDTSGGATSKDGSDDSGTSSTGDIFGLKWKDVYIYIIYSIYGISFLLGVFWIIRISLHSPYIERQDEYTHYFYARDSLQEFPSNLAIWLDAWGRPGNTITYSLASQISFNARRGFSIFLMTMTIVFVTGIAQKLLSPPSSHTRSLSPAIAFLPIFMWFQPWIYHYGFQSLTVIPFIFFLTAGVYFWLHGNSLTWASFFFGLLPLTRHEALPLIIVWIIFLFRRRLIRLIREIWYELTKDIDIEKPEIEPVSLRKTLNLTLITILPYFLWNMFFAAWANSLPLLSIFDTQSAANYPSRSLLYYVNIAASKEGVGWILFVAALIGAMYSLFAFAYRLTDSEEVKKVFTNITNARKDQEAARMFWWVLFFVYFLTHTVIIANNRFASGGFAEFVMPIAPLFALYALKFFELHKFLPEKPKFIQPTLTLFISFGVAVLIILSQRGSPYLVSPRASVLFISNMGNELNISHDEVEASIPIITRIPQLRYQLELDGYDNRLCPRDLWNIEQDIMINPNLLPFGTDLIVTDAERQGIDNISTEVLTGLDNKETVNDLNSETTFRWGQIGSNETYDPDYVERICGWTDRHDRITLREGTPLLTQPERDVPVVMNVSNETSLLVLGRSSDGHYYRVATMNTGILGWLPIDEEDQRRVNFQSDSELPTISLHEEGNNNE